jgi:CHAT domain-containing protein/tetratricopeptide (TPR) repeat protein
MLSLRTCQAVFSLLMILLSANSPHNDSAQSETTVQGASNYLSSQDAAEARSLSHEVQELADQGKYEEAIPKAARAVEIRKRIFTHEHPDVASSIGDLAYLHFKNNNYIKARELYDEAVAILDNLRLENQEAVKILNSLGLLYYAQEDLINAERFYRRALTMEEKLPQGVDHPKAPNIIANLALVLLDKGDSEGAEQLYRRVLKLREKQLDLPEPKLILMLNNVALAHYQIAKRAQAVRLFRLALDISKKEFGDDPPALLPIISNLLTIYLQDGAYGEAEILVQRGLVLLTRNAGNNFYYHAMAYNGIGQFHKAKGRHKKAEEFFQLAEKAIKKSSRAEQPYEAEILTNLGLLYLELGQYTKAEDPLQRAVAIRQDSMGEKDPTYATSIGTLGELYRRKGEYVKAESLYKQALTIYQNSVGELHAYSATIINNLGVLYYSRGDVRTAEDYFQKALKIREQVLSPQHPDIAVSLVHLAACYRSSSRLDEAVNSLQRALTIFEQSHDLDPFVAQTLNDLGLVHYDKGNLNEAESLFQRALAINEKILGSEDLRLTSTVNNLALVYQARGQLDRAEQFYQRALAITEKSPAVPHPLVATVLRNLSSASDAKGDIDRALDFARRAGEIEERSLDFALASGSEDQNHIYLRTFQNTTSEDISLHVHDAANNKSAARQALTTVLRRKGRVLDAMATNVRALRDRSSQRDKGLFNELAEVRAQLASMISEGSDRTDAGYNPAFVAKSKSYEKLQARVNAGGAVLRTHAQPVTIESIQKLIPEKSALVEFVCYSPINLKNPKAGNERPLRHYVAYILRRGGDIEWADLGEAQPIDFTVWDLRAALRNPKSTPDGENIGGLAHELYQEVMRPVLDRIPSDTKQLLISPDSMLQFVPFEAMLDRSGHYLIERYSVSYLSSARDLQIFQATSRSRQPPLIVVNPDFNTRVKQAKSLGRDSEVSKSRPVASSTTTYALLTGTDEEGRGIKRLYPRAQMLRGSDATEAALKQIRGPSILHIATHGFFPETQPVALADPDATKINGEPVFKSSIALLKLEGNPSKRGEEYIASLSRSGIVLAGANIHDRAAGEDGLLTALEMSGLDLRGTKLAVLSACETAMGDLESGNGVDGLRRALMLAGAETQVMSLWKVNDEITRETMIKFYTRLRAGATRAEALRQAKLDLLRTTDYAHPYFWASFIESGDWRRLA